MSFMYVRFSRVMYRSWFLTFGDSSLFTSCIQVSPEITHLIFHMSDGFHSQSPIDPLDPADEEEPLASPPVDPALDSPGHVHESLQSMFTQLQDLQKAQEEMKKVFLRQLILVVRDHQKLMQHQIDFQKQLTEINRRCQILQDWMMSPFRLVPFQVLQDNTLNIDTIHSVISEQPSDDDSWSVQ